MIYEYFNNNISSIDENVYIVDTDDNYTTNFGKQWRDYRDIQIDSINNFNISHKYLKELFFNNLEMIKNKEVLEIGCGAADLQNIY